MDAEKSNILYKIYIFEDKLYEHIQRDAISVKIVNDLRQKV